MSYRNSNNSKLNDGQKLCSNKIFLRRITLTYISDREKSKDEITLTYISDREKSKDE